MNARPVEVLRGSSFAPTPWRDVRVGDVVRICDRDAFPADLVLLSSSAMGSGGGGSGGNGGSDASPSAAPLSASPESATAGERGDHASSRPPPGNFPTGVAFVETANLDGETNLKMRQALPQTADLLSAVAICRATTGGGRGGLSDGGGASSLSPSASADSASAAHAGTSVSAPSLLRIECEQPNSAIYRFQGVLVTPEGERLPLSPNQLLLRGCVLRNTAWCLGVAVFAGGEAKIAQNATAVPSKRSAVERRLDKLVAGVFVLLGCLAGVNAVAGAYAALDPKMWYLALGERGERASTRALFDVVANRALVAGTTFLTSVALYSSLIPISLYVTIEVVKYAQAAVFVSGDRLMYDRESDTPAAARTSNLNEDLGQVRWLLSDKTGTLTCNRMDFFGFSVAGEMHGGSGGSGGSGGFGGGGDGVGSGASPSSALKKKTLALSPSFSLCSLSTSSGGGDGGSNALQLAPASASSSFTAAASSEASGVIPSSSFSSSSAPSTSGSIGDGSSNSPPPASSSSSSYSSSAPAAAATAASETSSALPPSSSSSTSSSSPSIILSDLRSKFHDARVSGGAWRSLPHSASVASLMRALSLCHTVMTEENEEKESKEEGEAKKRRSSSSSGGGGGSGSGFGSGLGARLLRAAVRRLSGNPAADPGVVSLTPLSAAASSASSSAKRITVTYQAASPDEVALVSGAAQLGFPLLRRTPTGVVVGEPEDAFGDAAFSSRSCAPLTSSPLATVERAYDILAVLEFSSARRRQSVVVRPSGAAAGADCELICKGADAALGPLLLLQSGKDGGTSPALWETTQRHLEQFGGSGLRTLCVASRTIPAAEYAAWAPEFAAARLRTDPGREHALEACCAELERGLTLLGATAIEDMLQEGVGDAIETLREANIATWVLTGDKLETAVNVAFSCRLLNSAQRRVEIAPRFVPPPPSGAGAGTAKDLEEADRAMAHDVAAQLEDALAEAEMDAAREEERAPPVSASSTAATSSGGGFSFFSSSSLSFKRRHAKRAVADANAAASSSSWPASTSSNGSNLPLPRALVVDGAALAFLLGDAARSAELLSLALRSEAVVFCRVSPLQKALVTRLLVNRGPEISKKMANKGRGGEENGGGGVALAIGDGANDVGMIQAAAVGVGIAGNEGMQAVMAADFALAQFRFLVDLLLVHGRWNYERVALVICYFFYKNAVYTLTQFWFNVFAAAHSGQRLYDDWHQSLFNLVFTACPVVVAGLLERDGGRTEAARAAAAEGGRLYRRTQEGLSMGCKALLAWALSALWHSAVCYVVPTLALAGGGGEGSLLRNLGLAGGGPHASSEGLWQTGTLGFTLVVVVVNLKLLVASRAHTFWHVLVVALSVGAYLAYLVVYSTLSPSGAVLSRIAPAATVYGIAGELARNPAAWVSLVVGTAACLLPDLALSSVAQRGKRNGRGGGDEEGNCAAAGVSVVVSAARTKSCGIASARSIDNKLKTGIAAEEEIPPSTSAVVAVAVAAESSSPAAPASPFPASAPSSSGRPTLHPLRSMSLQERISEHKKKQQQQRGGAGENDSTTSLARRSSAATAAAAATSSSVSSPSCSARHTGYAFDHPGFESFFADEAEREVRRTTSLSARVSGGGGGGGGGTGGGGGAVAAVSASSADDASSVAASSAAATAATSTSDAFSSSSALPFNEGEQLQLQRLSSSGRRYTATDAIDLA